MSSIYICIYILEECQQIMLIKYNKVYSHHLIEI